VIFFFLSSHYLEDLEVLTKSFHLILNNYYKPISSEELVKKTVISLFQNLDPYSYYLNKKDLQQLKNKTSEDDFSFGFSLNNQYKIIEIDLNGPAVNKLQEKDLIISLDGKTPSFDYIQHVLKYNNEIVLKVLRNKEYFDIKIKKKLIKDSLRVSLVDNVLVLKIKFFKKNIANEISKALKNTAYTKIQIDLYNNPGGILEEAISLASLFIQEGKAIELTGRDNSILEIHYLKKYCEKFLETPLEVLVNGSTASAAEIFAALIQDYGRGKVIGTQTFGKGSVQALFSLGQDAIKLTIALYRTLKQDIHLKGVTPDQII
jgi:carboxyl-terminal processing protease